MRFSFIIGCLIFLGSCQNDSETNEEVTGIVMEVEPSQLELDEIALVEQPETVQDFFALDNHTIGDDYCYDYNSLSQLILYENNVNEAWKQFEVSNNYLTAYHVDCGVLLEFITFELDGEKRAFLSQMTKNSQQFDYLKWNKNTEHWNKINQYPHPTLVDYFKNLDEEDTELVLEYGAENCYINPKSESVTFLFSEWGTLMKLGEKQLLEFNEKPNFYYELETVDDKLKLAQIPIFYPDQKQLSYLVAYSISETPTRVFRSRYNMLLDELDNEEIQHQLLSYGSNNFQAYFKSDTVDLSATKQDLITNGFWIYEVGKDPLVLTTDLSMEVIVQRAKAYFESED